MVKDFNWSDDFIIKLLSNKQESIKTGFKTFDYLTGGLTKGQVYGLAASTGVGKTRFALALMLSAWENNPNENFLFIGSEQTYENACYGLLAYKTKINEKKIYTQNYTKKEEDKLLKAAKSDKSRLYYVNMNYEGYNWIKVKEIIKNYNIDYIFYDYIGATVNANDENYWLSLKDETDKISKYAITNNKFFFIAMQCNINIKTIEKKPAVYDEQFIGLSKKIAAKLDVGMILTSIKGEDMNRRLDVYKHRWGFAMENDEPQQIRPFKFDFGTLTLSPTPSSTEEAYLKSLYSTKEKK